MIKSSSLSLKNYLSMLILRKSKNIDNNSILSRVSETVSRLKELTSKNDEFIHSTPSENAFTYSKSGKYNVSLQPNREFVSISTLENAFSDAKNSNLKALNNSGNTIVANNQDKYTSAINVINNLNTHIQTDEYRINGMVNDAEKNAFNRKMVNNQINNILKENGIELDSDFTCDFVIDPDNYRITVEKCDNQDLKEKIEQALNDGDENKDFVDRNGRNLYNHIYLSGKDYKNSQITHDGQLKRYVNDLVQEKTGINLKDCKNVGDDFITNDGQSVKELFLKQVEDEETTPENIRTFKELRSFYLTQVKDFDFTDDNKQVLRITYSNKGLHDIGQSQDFGGDLSFIREMEEEASKKDSRRSFTCFI
ncbi:protein of unknown function [Succinivibrio dextrinosolvens DSM 3072]|uniref:Uncharacterized protein n=1 Tax=Succinivibrio dextrinosolvens DSM 3072 TaxID=1123324 RepID=A0A1T4VY11_9GAMM|nr:DUF4885 family protein [Succinivibrio dextrinosolvens]SKA69698.1 protein of unknown function [Succinivibrio dextrinosolvens DSM 3072]